MAKKGKHRDESKSEGEIEEDETMDHPLVQVTKIDKEEIPEDPGNRFLYRRKK